jgi:hypothetical protein
MSPRHAYADLRPSGFVCRRYGIFECPFLCLQFCPAPGTAYPAVSGIGSWACFNVVLQKAVYNIVFAEGGSLLVDVDGRTSTQQSSRISTYISSGISICIRIREVGRGHRHSCSGQSSAERFEYGFKRFYSAGSFVPHKKVTLTLQNKFNA